MRLKATCALLTGLLAAGATAGQGVPAVAAAPAVSAAAAAAAVPAEISADDILERNFAALGGRERLRAVRTLRLEASQSAGDRTDSLRVLWKRPDRLRIEAPEGGLDTLQVFDGERAWFTYPALPGFGVQVLEGAARDALRAQADLVEGSTFDYAAKGHRVELLGREKLEGTGTEAWRLLLTTAQGDVRTLWIDAATFLQVREQRREFRAEGDVVIETDLHDFRAVGGILFAHRLESRLLPPGPDARKAGAALSVFTISKLELDVDIPDALFEPPAGPAPAPL